MKDRITMFKDIFLSVTIVSILVFALGCNGDSKNSAPINSDTSHTHSDNEDHVHTSACVPGKFPCDTTNYRMYNAPIAGISLEKEIGFKGRNVRLRYWVIAPEGRIGQHYHDARPAIVYFLEGEAYETKKDTNDQKIHVRTMKADEVGLESSGTIHWWVNNTKKMVKLFAVDIVPNSIPATERCVGLPRTTVFKGPDNPDDVKIEETGSHDLAKQFPNAPEVQNYNMRSRRITILPGQKTAVMNSKENPSVTYVVKGDGLEHRSDEETSIRRIGDCTTASNGISYYWENATSEPVVLFVVDFVKKGVK